MADSPSTSKIWLLSWLMLCALIGIGPSEAELTDSEHVTQDFPATGTTPSGQLASEDDDFLEVFGLPGFQHEFKIEIGAGGSECFYQKLRQMSKLHVSFEVLRGADRNIDVRITDPTQNVVGDFQWTSEGNLEHNITVPGIYSFCVDNSLSRFSSKLVYLYMLSYSESDWNLYVADVHNYYGGIENVTKSLEKFDQQINKVLVFQATGRRHLIVDWYLVRSSNSYVQRLSIAMCVIIIFTSALQVYFVRRLFHTSPRAKPRA